MTFLISWSIQCLDSWPYIRPWSNIMTEMRQFSMKVTKVWRSHTEMSLHCQWRPAWRGRFGWVLLRFLLFHVWCAGCIAEFHLSIDPYSQFHVCGTSPYHLPDPDTPARLSQSVGKLYCQYDGETFHGIAPGQLWTPIKECNAGRSQLFVWLVERWMSATPATILRRQ